MQDAKPEMSSNATPAKTSEWRSGGALLFSAMVSATCLAIPIAVLGTMVSPLSQMYGWPRASITSGILMCAVGTLVLGPIIGHIVDRVGARRVGLIGLVLMGLSICGIGLAGPSLASWYIAWAIFAAMQPVSGFIVWVNGVTSRFDRHLGLALGLMFTGTSLVISVLPPITVAIMENFGWRAVYFGLGGFTLLVALPLAFKFFVLPAPAASSPLQPGEEVHRPEVAEGLTLRQALASRQFWQLAMGALIASAGIAAVYVHLQPILTDAGATAAAAAGVIAIVGPASLVGRLGSGWLVDRFPPNLVTAIILLFPAMGFLLLVGFDGSLARAAIIAALCGVAQGAESDLLAFLTRRYFGRRAFSATYGFILGAYSIGFGIGPALAGLVFDRTNSYTLVIIPLGIACVIGAGLIAMLGKSRFALAKAAAAH